MGGDQGRGQRSRAFLDGVAAPSELPRTARREVRQRREHEDFTTAAATALKAT